MASNKYANNIMNDKRAKAIVKNLGVSTKQAIEVCNFLRGRELQTAKKLLEQIIEHKTALPMRRFNQEGAGHKKGGVGPGKYPENCCSAVHDLLLNVENNANQNGLDTNQLKIVHILAQRGSNQHHYGRSKRGVMKRTHLEVIVEQFEKKGKSAKKAPAKKAEPKKEAKAEVKPVEKKAEPKAEKPVEKKVEKPIEKKADKPAKPVEKKAPVKAEKPAEDTKSQNKKEPASEK